MVPPTGRDAAVSLPAKCSSRLPAKCSSRLPAKCSSRLPAKCPSRLPAKFPSRPPAKFPSRPPECSERVYPAIESEPPSRAASTFILLFYAV
ncbi:MAG: hypothetical protein ACI81V_000554 [Lentimonas sp.]|jgi:hypothetical protein